MSKLNNIIINEQTYEIGGGLVDGSVYYNHISDITYTGEPSGDITPSEDTPVNLYDPSTMLMEHKLIQNNTWTIGTYTGGNNAACAVAKIPIDPTKTYSMSTPNGLADWVGGRIGSLQFRKANDDPIYRIVLGATVQYVTTGAYDSNNQSITVADTGISIMADDNGKGRTISNLPEECAYIYFNVHPNATDTAWDASEYLMFEEGTACHDWVAYGDDSEEEEPVITGDDLDGCEITSIFKASLADNYAREQIQKIANTGAGVSEETLINEGVRTFGYKTEPEYGDIPVVQLNGDAFDDMGYDATTGVKNEVKMSLIYTSKTASFAGGIKIKWQGNLSISYPKHNFSIKLYTNSSCKKKLKVDLNGWGLQNKYVLKANWVDFTHSRNIVSARLWNDIVAMRNSAPKRMLYSPMNGAIDGFPVKLYVNGTYQGLYTWNIPKDGWMLTMDDAYDHVLMNAELNSGSNGNTSCDFNGDWSSTAWSVEYPDELIDRIKTKFNDMIHFIQNSTDADLHDGLDAYLDVESALDYYIFFYLNFGVDSLAKNMNILTYDGVKWYCSVYDMDAVWGNPFNGGSLQGTTGACPEDYNAKNSLLWNRIETVFSQELYDRYKELRSTVLSEDYIISEFERFWNVIPDDLLAQDWAVYSGIPHSQFSTTESNNYRTTIPNWIRSRCTYVDNEFEAFNAS